MTPLALNLVLLSEAMVIGSGAWFIFVLLHARFSKSAQSQLPTPSRLPTLVIGCTVLALGVFLSIFLSSALVASSASGLGGIAPFASVLINVGCGVILLSLPRYITLTFSRDRKPLRAARASTSNVQASKPSINDSQPPPSEVQEGAQTNLTENGLTQHETAISSAHDRPEHPDDVVAVHEKSNALEDSTEGSTEQPPEAHAVRSSAGNTEALSVTAATETESEVTTTAPEAPPLTGHANAALLTALSETQVSQKQDGPNPDANEKFRTVFYHSPAWFLVIDAQQHIVEANIRLANFLACDRAELIGQPLKNLIKKEDLQLIKGLTPERIRSKGPEFTIDIRLNHAVHEALWVKVIPQIITFASEKEDVLLLLQDIRESKQLSEKIAFHSQFDELTLLHNREGLETYLAQTLDVTSDKYGQIALLYIDVDQLKVVNDTCGHHAGDQLLQQLVAVIGEASESRDFFARMGGDEFALVKTNCSEEQAKQLGESVRSAAEDFTFTWQGQQYRQSVSVGIALSCDEINSIIDLIGAADSACYTAKEHGKNRVAMYNGSIETNFRSHRDMQWVSRLQKAIQSGAFELYFQPIEKLTPGPKPHVHYELLIRYVDDQGQHILPQHFLPAVERFGLSEQIDLWVLTTALDYLDKHPEHTKILDCCSINLTSQSIANPRIRSAILQVVQSYSFPLEKICFEITESSAIQNLAEAKEFVRELKTLGCHLALDDFGTGFSSFGYLKYLEVDYIKIDGSFVRDITSDRFDRAMVSAINNIGKEMGIAIIAEYAENASILKVLHHLEIDYAQGNAIAYPLPMYTLESYYQ